MGRHDLLHKDISYKVIGLCMEVHRELGHGFLEVVYKDALQYELELHGINFVREKKYEIQYKTIMLPRFYVADFIIEDKIILEVKAQTGIADGNYKQTINYLAVSRRPCGLLVNFGEPSLVYKRVVLTK